MWFDFARKEGFPTQYPQNATPVTVDVLEAALIAAFVILALSFLVALPSTKLKDNTSLFVRITTSLFIGASILLGNFGQEWEVAHVNSRVPYRAGIPQQINASVGIKIGLRSVNVTLKSNPDKGGVLENEIIDYNERFSWTWDQGRFGFGPYSGHLQRDFREAQNRGAPIAILWIVDNFVIDGEGFRHGRFYRTAGWYTHVVLWTAFPCWLLANIFFASVIHYGGYFLGLTGALQILANVLWSSIKNPQPLVIHLEDATITTKYGSSYWLTLTSGIICLGLSATVLVMHKFFDDALHDFFKVDPLNSNPDVYLTPQELCELRQKHKVPEAQMELVERHPQNFDDDDEEYQPIYLKRKTLVRQVTPIHKKKTQEDTIYGKAETFQIPPIPPPKKSAKLTKTQGEHKTENNFLRLHFKRN